MVDFFDSLLTTEPDSSFSADSSCLIDYTSLQNAFRVLDRRIGPYLDEWTYYAGDYETIEEKLTNHRFHSLVNFLESIVIFDHIVLPCDWKNLVEGLRRYNDYFYDLETLVKENIVKLYPKNILEETSHAWINNLNSGDINEIFDSLIELLQATRGFPHVYHELVNLADSSSGHNLHLTFPEEESFIYASGTNFRGFINLINSFSEAAVIRYKISHGLTSFRSLVRGSFAYQDDPTVFDSFVGTILSFLIRGFIYLELSFTLGLPYIPNPLREPALAAYGLTHQQPNRWHDIASKFVSAIREKYANRINDIAGVQLYEARVPFLFPSIVRSVDHPNQIMRKAIEIRNSKLAIEFRGWCSEMNQAIYNSDGKKVSHSLEQLESLSKRIEKQLGLAETPRVTSTFWILSMEHNLPRWLSFHPIGSRKKHLQFLYNSAIQSINIIQMKTELERIFSKTPRKF